MKTNYITSFQHLYESGAWFGETFQEKLKDITEKQAFTRPAPDLHSIAELVAHCICWRKHLVNNLRVANGPSPDDEASWPSLRLNGMTEPDSEMIL